MVICHSVQARARPAYVKWARCLKVMGSVSICGNFDIAQACSRKSVFGSEVWKLSCEWCSTGMVRIVRATALRIAPGRRLSFHNLTLIGHALSHILIQSWHIRHPWESQYGAEGCEPDDSESQHFELYGPWYQQSWGVVVSRSSGVIASSRVSIESAEMGKYIKCSTLHKFRGKR